MRSIRVAMKPVTAKAAVRFDGRNWPRDRLRTPGGISRPRRFKEGGSAKFKIRGLLLVPKGLCPASFAGVPSKDAQVNRSNQ